MATPPVPRLRHPSLFTVSPAHLAGRQALRGFRFQTAYIMYVLAGFAAGREDFAAARIEGVEDLDALIRSEGIWIERYYQVKSKQEGGGNWTLNLLDREGVLASFFSLYQRFQLEKDGESRRIELVLAVEGDLDGDLMRLRDQGSDVTDSKATLLGILCSNEAVSRDPSYECVAKVIREWCKGSADSLISGSITTAFRSSEFDDLVGTLSNQTLIPREKIEQTLPEVIREVTMTLDDFILSLRFDSRLGPLLEEATLARLSECGDLSPDEARTASDRLKRSIEDESALPEPTDVDRTILREWLGVSQRTVLQSKPSLSADTINRQALLGELSRILQTERIVLLHGLSKVGKSQLVSALIDHNHREDNYFWFTFLGDGGDLDRLTKQLVIWAGQKTARWQMIDDLEKVGLQTAQAFKRLAQFPVGGCFIVLDDCHKVTDAVVFEFFCNLVSRDWPESRLIMVSERKIPAAAALGAREIPLSGLSPKESLQFATKLGLDLSDSAVQFAMFSVQVDGHPIMLRAAVKELPPKPSFSDVQALAQRIPSVMSAQDFLNDLSNRIFFDLLRTHDQRVWLARLAAISFPFTQGLALKLADLEPRLQVLVPDWNYFKSLILDEIRADHYSVPALLDQIAASSISPQQRRSMSVSAAHYVLQAATASGRVDFWDFQHALFALLGAGCYDEVATTFIYAYPSFMRAKSFKPFDLLFLAMNGEQIHSKIADPFARRLMLQAEFHLRLQDEESVDYPRLLGLIRRMRVLSRHTVAPGAQYARAMVHIGVAFVKIRRLKEAQQATPGQRYRSFNPLQAALRLALASENQELLAEVLGLYGGLCLLATRPNVELLKEALLKLPRDAPWPISADAVITIYAKYAIGSKYDEPAMRLLERHSDVYRVERRNDAYFACEHAAATILHEGRSNYSQARERISSLLSRASELHLSPASLARGEMFIADTYWAERNYSKSAEYYQRVLRADFDNRELHQFVCERLCDSLIFLRRYEEAIETALMILRSEHSRLDPDQSAQLYGRLAYAYAEHGALKKAAIACLGLCRIAASAHSDPLNLLSAHMAGWVIQHFSYSDPAIPKIKVEIRDSNVLSDPVSVDQLNTWRDLDPFSTRGIVLAATLFELLGDWRRSEFLFQKALDIVRRSDVTTKSFRETAYVYLLRLARIHLRRRKLSEAATELKGALEYVMDVAREQGPAIARRGGGAYAQLKMVDPALQACSDEDVIKFFELLKGQFASDTDVKAWVSYRESEILFERFAVQAAKRRLTEAMQLARSSSEHELYWLVVQQRLFNRVQQMYARQVDWLQDALEVAVTLATEEAMAAYRQPFGESVYNLSRKATEGPFMQISSAVERFENERREHAFLVAAYAIWCVATRNQVLAASRNTLESYLRGNAVFLHATDFQ
jgi:tetratricopeptide (TPR) repeat protein